MNAVFQTDRGRIRSHNEDNGGVFHHNSSLCLAIVADGMGGHNAGDTASRMTIESFEKHWNETAAGIQSPDDAMNWLKSIIPAINADILIHASTHPECSGMGTTLVAALCTEKFCAIASIGDSRCYLQSEDGFSQVTEDHSLVNELVKSGEITKEAAESHPKKNVLTRALGTDEKLAVDYRTIMFEEGDLLLLCSDGLSNKVADAQMSCVLQLTDSLPAKADTLIQMANENGGEDNITVVILEHCAERESG
ncbi:Stp1/IreP family PP2C-type Ser/Thr phosphatase [Domibacillus sp. A3M-37]|uniref:Stp1/IreP family PP2C-type Ser/Thr phosphatase n=1 Tax=Domibacillus TaxID=1433999 RepID=UPI0020B89990|nr:Stp1/IreP family PP2C-type Ser/Thr phosphatase [Domibacillus sp. A3M-37]MCP3761948.1 Stp1/IreP family PP2C-type Ser/Thr phosphatase [Domibacillus sp. A3M-37]